MPRSPKGGPSTSRASSPAGSFDASATMGNSSRWSHGRQASMMALELSGASYGVGDEHRVVLRSHAAADDVDVHRRVGARRDRPHHLLQVRGIDVIVDHHRIARHVRADAALAEEVTRLARVPGVALLDGYDVEHARAADLVRPHRLHFRKARRHERIVQKRRAHHRLRVRVVVRRLGRRAANHDWFMAEIDPFDGDTAGAVRLCPGSNRGTRRTAPPRVRRSARRSLRARSPRRRERAGR